MSVYIPSQSNNTSIGSITIDTSSLSNTVMSYAAGTSSTASWTSSIAGGLTIQEGYDIKLGDRSLKEFIDKVDERLGILHPNEELESRWEQLKELRRQYQELEKDLLEKEKMWNILKDKNGS